MHPQIIIKKMTKQSKTARSSRERLIRNSKNRSRIIFYSPGFFCSLSKKNGSCESGRPGPPERSQGLLPKLEFDRNARIRWYYCPCLRCPIFRFDMISCQNFRSSLTSSHVSIFTIFYYSGFWSPLCFHCLSMQMHSTNKSRSGIQDCQLCLPRRSRWYLAFRR